MGHGGQKGRRSEYFFEIRDVHGGDGGKKLYGCCRTAIRIATSWFQLSIFFFCVCLKINIQVILDVMRIPITSIPISALFTYPESLLPKAKNNQRERAQPFKDLSDFYLVFRFLYAGISRDPIVRVTRGVAIFKCRLFFFPSLLSALELEVGGGRTHFQMWTRWLPIMSFKCKQTQGTPKVGA